MTPEPYTPILVLTFRLFYTYYILCIGDEPSASVIFLIQLYDLSCMDITIKNHEIYENKMLKSQNVHKNKLYKVAIFNCFKNNKIFFNFFNFLPKNVIKLKN